METATVTQEKPEVKVMEPYQIKKQKDTGKFKILSEKTGELLEGFEDKEFGSPLEASRFMKTALGKIDRKVTEFKISENSSVVAEVAIPTDIPSSKGFEIPIIEGMSPVIEVIGNTRHYEVIIREHDEPKRTSEPFTDGFNTTYLVALGKKVILPEAVINTAKEAVYTIIETHQDDKTLKCTTIPRESPRFSVEIIREVSADEARKWIVEQKKTNINIF